MSATHHVAAVFRGGKYMLYIDGRRIAVKNPSREYEAIRDFLAGQRTLDGKFTDVLDWLSRHGLRRHPPIKANRTRVHRKPRGSRR